MSVCTYIIFFCNDLNKTCAYKNFVSFLKNGLINFNFNFPFFFPPGFVHCQNTQLLLLGVLRKFLLKLWVIIFFKIPSNFLMFEALIFYLLLVVWFCQFLEIRRRLAVAVVVRQWIHHEDFRTCLKKKLTVWITKIFDL